MPRDVEREEADRVRLRVSLTPALFQRLERQADYLSLTVHQVTTAALSYGIWKLEQEQRQAEAEQVKN